MYSSLSRSSPESSGDKRDVMLAADFEMNQVSSSSEKMRSAEDGRTSKGRME